MHAYSLSHGRGKSVRNASKLHLAEVEQLYAKRYDIKVAFSLASRQFFEVLVWKIEKGMIHIAIVDE